MARYSIPVVVQQALLLFAAFLFARTVAAGVQWLVAFREGIPAVLTPWGITFFATQSQWLQCNCVVAIYLSGPLIAAGLGAVLWGTYPLWHHIRPWMKTFLLWVSNWLVLLFMMGWLGGIGSGQGLGYVASWMYLPNVLVWALTLLLLVGVVLLGLRLRRRLFRTLGYSMAAIEQRQSRADALWGYGVPLLAVLAAVAVGYSRAPGIWVDAVWHAAGGLLLVVPMGWARSYLAVNAFRFPEQDATTLQVAPVAWVLSILFIVGWVALAF